MGCNKYNNFALLNYRKKKSGLSKSQVDFLVSIYMINNKPTTLQRLDMAEKLGISEDKVRNWFQNKRAKDKRLAKNKENKTFDTDAVDSHSKLYPNCNDLYRKRENHEF